MVGLKGKLVLAKQKAVEVFRLISSSGKEDSNISSSNAVFRVAAPYETMKARTRALARAERTKAEALVYWRMWDRPK